MRETSEEELTTLGANELDVLAKTMTKPVPLKIKRCRVWGMSCKEGQGGRPSQPRGAIDWAHGKEGPETCSPAREQVDHSSCWKESRPNQGRTEDLALHRKYSNKAHT